jgi:hypothetical protein
MGPKYPVSVNGTRYFVYRDEVNVLPDSVIEVLRRAGFEILDVPEEE